MFEPTPIRTLSGEPRLDPPDENTTLLEFPVKCSQGMDFLVEFTGEKCTGIKLVYRRAIEIVGRGSAQTGVCLESQEIPVDFLEESKMDEIEELGRLELEEHLSACADDVRDEREYA